MVPWLIVDEGYDVSSLLNEPSGELVLYKVDANDNKTIATPF